MKNTKTIEELKIQRMYLQLQELKIILNNAKDSVTGEILLDNTLNEHVRHILKSLIQNDDFLIGGCLILHKALGIKTTTIKTPIKILIDRGDYNDEYSSILDYILRGADLSDANLKGANLDSADLTGADLTGADLKDVVYAD